MTAKRLLAVAALVLAVVVVDTPLALTATALLADYSDTRLAALPHNTLGLLHVRLLYASPLLSVLILGARLFFRGRVGPLLFATVHLLTALYRPIFDFVTDDAWREFYVNAIRQPGSLVVCWVIFGFAVPFGAWWIPLVRQRILLWPDAVLRFQSRPRGSWRGILHGRRAPLGWLAVATGLMCLVIFMGLDRVRGVRLTWGSGGTMATSDGCTESPRSLWTRLIYGESRRFKVPYRYSISWDDPRTFTGIGYSAEGCGGGPIQYLTATPGYSRAIFDSGYERRSIAWGLAILAAGALAYGVRQLRRAMAAWPSSPGTEPAGAGEPPDRSAVSLVFPFLALTTGVALVVGVVRWFLVPAQ